MALPEGFTAATITAGPVVDMRGTPAELTVEVTTVLGGPTHITNSATDTEPAPVDSLLLPDGTWQNVRWQLIT